MVRDLSEPDPTVERVRDAQRYLDGLDDQQRQVATSFGAPVAVLAGAGTGKTRAITHRIAYGVASGRMVGNQTLAVTFTNKAAAELAHRLHGLGVPGVQARTFHAAALRQLRYFWPTVEGSELPQVVSSTFPLIAQAARGIAGVIDTSLLRDLAQEISWAKVSNITPENYPELAAGAHRQVAGLEASAVAAVLSRYEQTKRRNGVIDFDDILLCTIGMLRAHPDVLDRIRAQYRYFTVDEFQDVSPVQRTLLELWTGDSTELCVVGDVNQSIHTFAGAQPAYLLNFAAEHPGAVVLRLTRNYRSTPEILTAANGLIDRRAALVPTRASGREVQVVEAEDEPTEIAGLVGWLRSQHEDHAWEEMGVLYRINSQAEAVCEALDAAGIPYQVRESAGSTRESTQAGAGVTLSTMHAAKGLEWECVAVIGVSEGLVPFIMATTAAELAEERRLLYVALTRARSLLRVSWAAGGQNGRGNRSASRYLVRAGLVDDPVRSPRTPRGRGRARRPVLCRVCGERLELNEEVKLGRHLSCEVDVDEQLFERLRTWRAETAREASVPAFVIFTDATLRALAEQRPTTQAELRRVPGIGAVKLERHGAQLLEILTADL